MTKKIRLGEAPALKALGLMQKKDVNKIRFLAIVQILLSFIDLLAVALIGLLGALAVSGVKSESPGSRAYNILNFLNLNNVSFQFQIAALGTIASTLLVGRSLLSVYIIRKSSMFLAHIGAELATELTSRLLASSLRLVQKYSTQDFIYGLGYGINAIFLGIVATSMSIIADLSVLLVISFGLFLIQPTIALSSLFFFFTLGLILHKFMGTRAREYGIKNRELSIQSDEMLITSVDSYRELFVSGRLKFLQENLSNYRNKLAETSAQMQLLPSISKYVFESAVVLGALIISGIQFIVYDANQAVASMALFLAAGSRIAPAALRIQQSFVTIRNSQGSAALSYQLISELKELPLLYQIQMNSDFTHNRFKPAVKVVNLSFRYPESKVNLFSGISFDIHEGEFVAIVGQSGAGKTTLVDLILGVHTPGSGNVLISGVKSRVAIREWPGAIAYVPQDIQIINGTVRENLCLGYGADEINDDHLAAVLELAQLADFVTLLPKKLSTPLGARGIQLSGGQKQRLGIARALVSNPKLLILDEATSALDDQTEADVTTSILKLRGKITIISIAHRLSTVKSADQTIYVANQNILVAKTFEELSMLVPQFKNESLWLDL